MTEELKKSVALHAGCVPGASDLKDYLKIINEAGFTKIEIKKQKRLICRKNF
jgi:hypothetical protein